MHECTDFAPDLVPDTRCRLRRNSSNAVLWRPNEETLVSKAVEKEQYKRITDHIDAIKDVWQERLGLSHFEIEHVYLDSFLGDDGEEDFKVTACTETRWNYLMAKIKWYLPSATRHSLETIEKVLVHELCHVLLAPEQVLIDAKLAEATADQSMTDHEFSALQDQYYERLEMSTEMATKAIMAGWIAADIAASY